MSDTYLKVMARFHDAMIKLETHTGTSQEELQEVKKGILEMSEQLIGFYFSCNADKSAHDYTIYVNGTNRGTAIMGARYKNSDSSNIYEIEMDAEDLVTFGNMCIDLAKRMKAND